MVGRQVFSHFHFVVLLLWFWTVVFVVHCCITFQVYIYNWSYQLSSQLLRRNHAFLTYILLYNTYHSGGHIKTQIHIQNTSSPVILLRVKGLNWELSSGSPICCLQTHGLCLWQSLVDTFEDRGVSESPESSITPSTEWGVPIAGKYRGLFDLQFHLRYKPLCNRQLYSLSLHCSLQRMIRHKVELRVKRRNWVK